MQENIITIYLNTNWDLRVDKDSVVGEYLCLNEENIKKLSYRSGFIIRTHPNY